MNSLGLARIQGTTNSPRSILGILSSQLALQTSSDTHHVLIQCEGGGLCDRYLEKVFFQLQGSLVVYMRANAEPHNDARVGKPPGLSRIAPRLLAPLLLSQEDCAFIMNRRVDIPERGDKNIRRNQAVPISVADIIHQDRDDSALQTGFGDPVDLSAILNGTDTRTTVMLRRVPRRLTQKDLQDAIEGLPGLQGSIEFIYLPKDSLRGTNRGFAFVNFHNHLSLGWIVAMQSDRDSLPSALRTCLLYYARIQGSGAGLSLLMESSEQQRNPRQ